MLCAWNTIQRKGAKTQRPQRSKLGSGLQDCKMVGVRLARMQDELGGACKAWPYSAPQFFLQSCMPDPYHLAILHDRPEFYPFAASASLR